MKKLKRFYRILSVIYFIGFLLHVADVFGLRLQFSEMNLIWKIWIVSLLVFDLLAAIGLWFDKKWGVALFLLVAASQLIAYLCLQEIFGAQYWLIAFHFLTLLIFAYLRIT